MEAAVRHIGFVLTSSQTDVLKHVECVALVLVAALMSSTAFGQIAPVKSCDSAGVGSVKLKADAPATITSASIGTAGKGSAATPYCLVKVRVPSAINIWVGLPMKGKWNGRIQSEGGGGYAGYVGVPTYSILGGYVGIQTDTGHAHTVDDNLRMGDFGLLSPGVPNTPLQKDFAYRSEHLMAVIGKQLAESFYGRQPIYYYWNGCSTGGRQGLRMAQDFPGDYDGILAGAPAIHWDRFQAYQLWPQVLMKELAGGVISPAKESLATNAAVAACDANDGVVDGIIGDPRKCHYSVARDISITRAACTSSDSSCLTPGEATAIDRIWNGATDVKGALLWPGVERGTRLEGLAGPTPFVIAENQARYWVYLDPTWDWHVLTLANYEEFFKKTVQMVGPLMATESPDLSAFRAHGGKMISWHGFSDGGIMPEGTIMYYDSVVRFFGKGYSDVQPFYRLFMAPGVEHCGGGDAPQPGRPATEELPFAGQENLFQALVNWVEHGQAPGRVLASQSLPGGATRTRPLCPYPAFAKYLGRGSTDDAASFVCVTQ
jgi:hypothetical protein